MRSQFMKGVLVGSLVAAIVTIAGTALAGTGIGAVFNVGRTNTVNRASVLTGTTSGRMLQVTNKGTGAALGLTVRAGKAPLVVNSTAMVANLNADTVDGKHASDLMQPGDNFVFQSRQAVALPATNPTDVATIPGFGVLKMTVGENNAYAPTFTNTESAETVFVSMGGGYTAHLAPGETYTANVVEGLYHLFLSDSTHVADLHVWWEGNVGSTTVFVQGISK